jgi:hypothetical protein
MRQDTVAGDDQNKLIGYRKSDNTCDEEKENGGVAVPADPKAKGVIQHLQKAMVIQIRSQ